LIIILIDSREHNGPYIQKRLQSQGIEAEIECLPQNTGSDYLILGNTGTCAVQRKVVISEMITEIESGEILNDIAPRLAGFSDNPAFLIEENFAINSEGYIVDKNSPRESGMLVTSYYGVLETIRKMGIDVYTARDLNHSIWWMCAMHKYLEKNHYPKHRKFSTVEEQAIGMMMCVPGVGEVRAGKALAQMSIAEMATAQEIPGLTKVMQGKVKKVVGYHG